MNAHTNQMIQTLKQAGIKTPTILNQLWSIIKEQPGSTYRQIKDRASHLNPSSIASQLNELEKRSMAYSRPADINRPRVKAYFTDMERYELRPNPNSAKEKKARIALVDSVLKAEVARVDAEASTISHMLAKAAVPSQDWAAYVDTLTVAEARHLYKQLRKMFGA